MEKIIFPHEQEQLLVAAGGVLSTFIDDCAASSLIKAAANNVITEKMIRENMPDKDHFGIHHIIMGASEQYGFNKNGDWWTEKGLTHRGDKYGYETFQKFGHMFREHRNRDPKLKIGDIKVAAWNDPLKRVELFMHGHKKKAAEEYELAKAGKPLYFSMSARVPYDICSCCDHRAKRSSEYCPHLKYRMTQWLPQFSKFAYAINTEPKFFDSSRVANPADRIAHHLDYVFNDELEKAASAGEFLFSDVRAERHGILLPSDTFGCVSDTRRAWLTKLAAQEDYVNAVISNPGNVARDNKYQFTKYAALRAFRLGDISEQDLGLLRTIDSDVMFREMAKLASVLPFEVFAAYTRKQTIAEARNDAVVKYARAKLLPTMFADTLKAPANSRLEELFLPAGQVKASAFSPDFAASKALMATGKYYSVLPHEVRRRTMLADDSISDRDFKSANEVTDEQKIAAQQLTISYALYKVAFCEAVTQFHGQESVDDAVTLLITSQHKNALVPAV